MSTPHVTVNGDSFNRDHPVSLCLILIRAANNLK